jgi:hypothetical protein
MKAGTTDPVASVRALLEHTDRAAVDQGLALARALPPAACRTLLAGTFLGDGRREVNHRTPPAGTLVLGALKGPHAAYAALTLLLRAPGRRPLRELHVRERTLTHLPEELFEERTLVDLEVSDSALTELSPRIGELVHLERLACGQTTLTALPESLGDLQELVWLDLYGFGGTELPASIGRLAALEGLDLENTKLEKLPDLRGCTRLHWLLTDREQCLFLYRTSHARAVTRHDREAPVRVLPGHSRQR